LSSTCFPALLTLGAFSILHILCADQPRRNAVHGDFDKEVAVPTTIEDIDVVSVARQKIKEYFEHKGKDLHKSTETRAKL
jgi:hypothetical protein